MRNASEIFEKIYPELAKQLSLDLTCVVHEYTEGRIDIGVKCLVGDSYAVVPRNIEKILQTIIRDGLKKLKATGVSVSLPADDAWDFETEYVDYESSYTYWMFSFVATYETFPKFEAFLADQRERERKAKEKADARNKAKREARAAAKAAEEAKERALYEQLRQKYEDK